jgi:hypothetical protein
MARHPENKSVCANGNSGPRCSVRRFRLCFAFHFTVSLARQFFEQNRRRLPRLVIVPVKSVPQVEHLT